MATWVCTTCGEEKPLTKEFFSPRKDGKTGFHYQCRICISKKRKEYYQEFKEEIKAKVRAYRTANPEKVRVLWDEWEEEYKFNKRDWGKENYDKMMAQKAVHKAIKRGTLIRGTECEDCGVESGKLHGHHEDYNRRFDLIWLCQSCHMRRHHQ